MATAIGALAVLLWSTLALLTVGAKRIPPFELLALSFAIAAAAGFASAASRGARVWPEVRRHPAALALAACAFTAYHFLYFVALRNAPAVDASLIAYLWPLLIVVFAGLAGGGLRLLHVAGAVLGLAGAWLIVSTRGALTADARYLTGYAAAAGCALVWSAYSVANRRYRDAPTDLVTLACLATALIGAVAHLTFEETVAPSGVEWIWIGLLGLGPVGLAFFFWDHGTKHGKLALLGTLSYAAPVLSTLLLVFAGEADASWQLAASALLVAAGAALAALARAPSSNSPAAPD